MMRRETLRRRAFTTVELIVAATIGAVFSLAVAQAVISVSGLATTLTREASIEQTSRNVLDIASRAVRNARPAGACLAPSTSSPATSCTEIVDRTYPPKGASAFVSAKSDEAVFFAYASRAEAGPSVKGFAAPDVVEIKLRYVDNDRIGRLCVTVHSPPAASTDDFVTAWGSVRPGSVTIPATALKRETCVEPLASKATVGTAKLLTYSDASGNVLATNATTGEVLDPEKIAYVRIAPILEFNAAAVDPTTGSKSRTRTYEQFVAVNYAVYAGGGA
jgi:hypothetical protein